MQKKKKTNVFLFTIIMTISFIFITEIVIYNYGISFLYEAITMYPKGNLVISEAILATLVLIVMLIFKNSYVFTQKKQKIGVGLFYGLFYIIFSLFVILIGEVGIFRNIYSVLNLALGCFLIGICEEFLCRGWLLNEFLERFGKTKKGVWYSIIVSGLIFGLMHIMNISLGQPVPATIVQVISAAATGIVLGLIYYKTKNIWSVILLHALWDFAVMTSEIAPIYEKQVISEETSIISMFFTILIALSELIIIIPHIKNLNTKPKKGSIIGMTFLALILFALFSVFQSTISSSMGETYKYGNINLKQYAITRDNYEEYYINDNQYLFKLSKNKKNNLIISNLNTNYFVEFECNELYDYILYKENDIYILAYIDFVDMRNTFLKYKYIPVSSLSDNNVFLNSLKTDLKKYLLPNRMTLEIIKDVANNKSYLSAYNIDYGNYLLINENQMAILNRD